MSVDTQRIVRTCKLIADDMEADVAKFDGAVLDGRVMAEIHGSLAAAVSALAGMVSTMAEVAS